MTDFSKRPESIEEIFRLIARSALGRSILERFMPLQNKGFVRVQSYPLPLLEQLRAAVGEGQPIGACLIVDSEARAGTLFLDLSAPIGILAPFLIHEMVHALDRSVWMSGELGDEDREQSMLHSEVSAFEAQHRFTQELRERLPGYEAFLKTQFPRARILHELLTADTVKDLYGRKAS